MAWSWSHTQEAYDAAKANCYALDHETLTVIWAEWRAYAHQSGVGSFDADNYPACAELRREAPHRCSRTGGVGKGGSTSHL